MNYLRLRSLLFRLDPETAHRLTLGLLGLVGTLPPLRRVLRNSLSVSSPSLRVRVFGLDFANPIGLAAGYDKNGSAMHGLACLGFGHIELGTVTPRAQSGNPRPRIYRLREEEALVNRMGFPNQGAARLAGRLRRRKPPGIVVGVNLGKGIGTPLEEAAQDYLSLIRLFHPWADYLVINLSSPNTAGLRRLQDGPALSRLLAGVDALQQELESESARHVPLLVKLSPDLESAALGAAVHALVRAKIDGVVATNTTLSRDGVHSPEGREAGGLSGGPLRRRSTDLVREISQMTGGELPIVAAGGVMDAASAQEKLEAGATLVQVFSGLIFRGPGMVRQILLQLARAKDAEGFPTSTQKAAPLGRGAG